MFEITDLSRFITAPFSQPVLVIMVTGILLLLATIGLKIKLLGLELDFNALMQPLISIVLLCACLFVILSRAYDATDKHWAYGTLGTLIGFWFHPATAPRNPTRKKPKSN